VIPPLRALSCKSPRARCFGPPVPRVTVGTTFKVKVGQGHQVDRGHQGVPRGSRGPKIDPVDLETPLGFGPGCAAFTQATLGPALKR